MTQSGYDRDFKNCTLWISGRSPFARRVRLAFLEADLPFELRIEDVWHPKPELLKLNPVGRVPFVVFKDTQEVLIESSVILEEFYDSIRDTRHRHPRARFWSALALGLIEKTIEYFLETQRPEVHRDQEWLAEIDGAVTRSLSLFEKEMGERQAILEEGFSQVDWDMGSALGYLEFRYKPDFLKAYPRVRKYLDRLSEREHFISTRPTS